MRIGDLRDRIRIETPTAGAWAVFAVVWANVIAGPDLRLPSESPSSPLAMPGDVLFCTIRYNGGVARGMRIRRGSDTLVVYQNVDVDGRRLWSKIVCERFYSYVTRHDATLGAVLAQGASITFTNPQTAATYQSATDTPNSPAIQATVAGVAMQDPGDQQAYVPNTVKQGETLKLLFVPSTYGEFPQPGATAAWAGNDYSLASLEAIAPDGVALGAHVVLTR